MHRHDDDCDLSIDMFREAFEAEYKELREDRATYDHIWYCKCQQECRELARKLLPQYMKDWLKRKGGK